MSIHNLAQNADYKELKSLIEADIDDIIERLLNVSPNKDESPDKFAFRVVELQARRQGLQDAISYVKQERTFDYE